ncbi:DUF4231 domain-containing protein [Alsobacter sp. SYSU M60028]|uniref:DUF4231 domain-containing protein n=1 Tax=Alsobacter ponti TaxID=2962936 RepID=A0ABT1LI84_9HYPH|nr:DUF4231 domain-containing protein [Alsobacter ponti]MCP8940826.1 DUF4231 domain-containing protein [Alsobacter ponti]
MSVVENLPDTAPPPAPDAAAPLARVAQRAADWSATAGRLNAAVTRTRKATLGLSLAGAAAATLASQMASETPGRAGLLVLGAVILAAGNFISARLGGPERIASWTRARAIAEAMKSEAFRYAARAAPYDDPATARERLPAEARRIEEGGDDLLPELTQSKAPGSAPRDMLSPTEYRDRRVVAQIDLYYRPRAELSRRRASLLRKAEFGVALAATLITAAAGATGKTIPFTGVPFDIAAVTALLTTVGAGLLSHAEASRYGYLAASYLATANRLEAELAGFDAAAQPGGDWSGWVARCEAVMSAETQGWQARWTRPPGGG